MSAARRFRLRFSGRINYLKIVRDFMKDVLDTRRLDALTVHSVVSAVDEAIANVITHAFDGPGVGEVTLEVAVEPEAVAVSIRHRGRGFDPSAVPSPDLARIAAERKKGGLGLAFMREFMDEVRFDDLPDGQHECRLRKRLPARP